MTVAHETRRKVLDMLNIGEKLKDERAMIIDISALTWNFDTYAIVGGAPEPVKVRAKNKEALCEHVTLVNVEEGGGISERVREGVLMPQHIGKNDSLTWIPANATLRSTKRLEESELMEFIFEPMVNPNDDRLEHWEQQVTGPTKHIMANRAKMAVECMRNMMRFYELDRIICWDLSWGAWEAKRRGEATDGGGFPQMEMLRKLPDQEDEYIPFSVSDDNTGYSDFHALAQPITTDLLTDMLNDVAGYYLVGGNTYTMSLYHNMWEKEANDGGHISLLRKLLKKGEIFYMGHSAGAIMSGPNILTATFKGIDAFSIAVQPYNAPYVKLPPSETEDSFFITDEKKNDLTASRIHMLNKMRQYGAWKGFRVVEALTFPHYDSRPCFSSFPQSAETYLRATDENGIFKQNLGTLLLPTGKEARDVTKIRKQTNRKGVPCLPIANGHAMVLPNGGVEVIETLSPKEERQRGFLHWDTYMPLVPDKNYKEYASGRTQFTAGSLTAKAVAGDRSAISDYNGFRITPRLQALGLPYHQKGDVGLFRK